MKFRIHFLATLLVVIFAGCAPSPSGSKIASQTKQFLEDATQMPAGNSSRNEISPINTPDFSGIIPPPPEPNPFVELVEEDLAGRLKIDIDQIQLLKITDIDWQDIKQGCTSSPGQTTKKGRVSGYRIWLEANGKNYLYHIGLDNTIVFCTEQY